MANEPTDAELEQLRRSLSREIGREKDVYMRSHLSNLAEVIETYLKADEERRPTVRIYLAAALVRLENWRLDPGRPVPKHGSGPDNQ